MNTAFGLQKQLGENTEMCPYTYNVCLVISVTSK